MIDEIEEEIITQINQITAWVADRLYPDEINRGLYALKGIVEDRFHALRHAQDSITFQELEREYPNIYILFMKARERKPLWAERDRLLKRLEEIDEILNV